MSENTGKSTLPPDLSETLPPELHDDAERLYEETGALDPRDALGLLHKRGLLDKGQLREALMALEELTIRHIRTLPPTGSEAGHQFLGELGAGAMGEVLLAKDGGLGRVVAVKRLLPEMAKRKALVRRFYKEAQITAQLDHPAIVPIHGLVEDDDGSVAYSMKLVRGETLEDYLHKALEQAKAGGEDERHVLNARLERFLAVCDAMAYAHKRGVLHRDLKPENIMVGAFGQVIVMDWGIAKLLDQAEEPLDLENIPLGKSANKTRVGLVMGTPRYMSPEQAHGKNDVIDARSDQYALGLILQELVALSPAVPTTLDLEGCLDRARQAKRDPMKHAAGGTVPTELVAVVDKACAPTPEGRYDSVSEMADDVRRYLRDEAVAARPDTLIQKQQRWIGHHRGTVMAMMLAMMLLVVLGGGGLAAMGAAGAVGMWWRGEVREDQLTGVMHRVAARGAQVDHALGNYESALTGLAFAAQGALEEGGSVSHDPRKAPPGMAKSKAYGTSVSPEWPDLYDAGRASSRDLKALASLGPAFRRAAVDATGIQGSPSLREQRQGMLDVGSPIYWARVVTSEGTMATFPGKSAATTKGPDPRKQEWYTKAKSSRKVIWSDPIVDPRGGGVVLPVSVGVFDSKGKSLGVAAIFVSLQSLVDTKLKAPTKNSKLYLVDKNGLVLARSGDDVSEADKVGFGPFPEAAWKRISSGPSHGTLDGGSGMISWARLTGDLTLIAKGSW